MDETVSVDLAVDVEIDERELGLEVGEAETAETTLSEEGVEVTVRADIERVAAAEGEYEAPEFEDATTEEALGESVEEELEDVEEQIDD